MGRRSRPLSARRGTARSPPHPVPVPPRGNPHGQRPPRARRYLLHALLQPQVHEVPRPAPHRRPPPPGPRASPRDQGLAESFACAGRPGGKCAQAAAKWELCAGRAQAPQPRRRRPPSNCTPVPANRPGDGGRCSGCSCLRPSEPLIRFQKTG